MQPWIEQRQHVRQSMHIDGTAVLDDGMERIPIVIVNLSRTGAMIRLPDSQKLPERVVLLFDHSVEPCQKIWHEGLLAGVQFVE